MDKFQKISWKTSTRESFLSQNLSCKSVSLLVFQNFQDNFFETTSFAAFDAYLLFHVLVLKCPDRLLDDDSWVQIRGAGVSGVVLALILVLVRTLFPSGHALSFLFLLPF